MIGGSRAAAGAPLLGCPPTSVAEISAAALADRVSRPSSESACPDLATGVKDQGGLWEAERSVIAMKRHI